MVPLREPFEARRHGALDTDLPKVTVDFGENLRLTYGPAFHHEPIRKSARKRGARGYSVICAVHTAHPDESVGSQCGERGNHGSRRSRGSAVLRRRIRQARQRSYQSQLRGHGWR